MIGSTMMIWRIKLIIVNLFSSYSGIKLIKFTAFINKQQIYHECINKTCQYIILNIIRIVNQ